MIYLQYETDKKQGVIQIKITAYSIWVRANALNYG